MLVVDESGATKGYEPVAQILALGDVALVDSLQLAEWTEHLECVWCFVVVTCH